MASKKKPAAAPAAKKSAAKPAAAPRAARSLKVRALKPCYFNHSRQRVGDVFTLESADAFEPAFMEWVDPQTPEQTTGAQAALNQEHDRILEGKVAGKGKPDPDSVL